MNLKNPLKHIFLLIAAVSFMFMATSNQEHKTKLIIFEGSDWCVKCIQLEKNILSDSTFVNFVNDNKIELERIDFPQRKKLDKAVLKYNESLADKFKFDGSFPTLMLVDSDFQNVHKIHYSHQNTSELIALIQSKISSAK